MMEKISRDLGVAKTKKESMMESCRKVNEESSAVMLTCLQLDNLEQHFEGIQRALESSVEENLERERFLEERWREVVAKEHRLGFLQEEIRRKEEELEIAERRVKECVNDCVKTGTESVRLGVLQDKVRRKQEELRIVEKRVKECDNELERSRGPLNQCLSMLKDREIELNSANRLLKECCEEYDQKKSEVDALSDRAAKLEVLSKDYASKKDELDSIDLDIEKKVIELQAKEKQHEAFQNSINEQLAIFDGKKLEFESLECSSKRITGEIQARECELKKAMECLKELGKKIESKNEELASVQGLIAAVSEVLEAKKGDLLTISCKIDKHNIELAKKEKEVKCIQKRTRKREEDLQRKEKQAASFRSSIRECLDDLEYKKRQISCLNESLFHISEEVEFKKKDLEQIRQESMEYHWELEKREKRLDFLQASLDEQCKLLELNERNFLDKVMDFEHRQRQLLSREKSLENLQGVRMTPCSEAANHRQQVEVKSSENRPSSGCLIKAPASPIISSVGCNTSNDEFMIWKLCGLDPSKEVLDIIEESFERLQSCGDAALSDSICRRCIYLLDRLAQHAPPFMDGIKERALKMAREWELKLRTNAEGRSEVIGFLCLLDAYKLVSYFDRHGITKLVETFSLYKSHPELCQAIGLVDMNTAPPERGTSSSSPRFTLRPHRENKRPLPATDARRLQLPPKRRVAPFDRS